MNRFSSLLALATLIIPLISAHNASADSSQSSREKVKPPSGELGSWPMFQRGCSIERQGKEIILEEDLRNPDCKAVFQVDTAASGLSYTVASLDCRSALDSLRNAVTTTHKYVCTPRFVDSQSASKNNSDLRSRSSLVSGLTQCLHDCRRVIIEENYSRVSSETDPGAPTWPAEGVCSMAEISQNFDVLSRMLCSGAVLMVRVENKETLVPRSPPASALLKPVDHLITVTESEVLESGPDFGRDPTVGWLTRLQKCATRDDCAYLGFRFKRTGSYFSGCKILSGGTPVRKGVTFDDVKSALPKGANVFFNEDDCLWEQFKIDRPGLECFAGQCIRGDSVRVAR